MAASQSIESFQQAALELQPAARAQLNHTLVQSLAALSESEISELWQSEAKRRDAEMDSGEVAGVPGEDVFRLHARYKK